jgi:hypothetical protein
MTTEEVIRYVLSFLGGGVVSGGMSWARETWSARRREEIDHLQRQLQLLYGPLHFFTTQAVELLDLANRFHATYTAEYVSQKFSQEPATQEALRQETQATLRLANQYVERVDRNNEKIMGILESNWNLIDSDDTEVFASFQVNYTRLRTERRPEGGVLTPDRVYRHIGDISFIRPEFINRVDEKFRGKRARLDRLLKLKGRDGSHIRTPPSCRPDPTLEGYARCLGGA